MKFILWNIYFFFRYMHTWSLKFPGDFFKDSYNYSQKLISTGDFNSVPSAGNIIALATCVTLAAVKQVNDSYHCPCLENTSFRFEHSSEQFVLKYELGFNSFHGIGHFSNSVLRAIRRLVILMFHHFEKLYK